LTFEPENFFFIPMKNVQTNIEIKQLELSQATRFVVALERGEGDTIVDVEKYWGAATVRDIHEQIMAVKAASELQLP
jgi:hypothetical protein